MFARVPSRGGGVLKTGDSRGYITESNCWARYCAWASERSTRSSLRQSPAGYSRFFEIASWSLATHTSMFVPSARSV